MHDWRGAALVLLILGAGLTVGAAAGYRLHLQQDWQANGTATDAQVTIDWPDGTKLQRNVTVAPGNATALGALLATAESDGFEVVTSFFDDFGGSYVYSIDGHAPARGSECGWMYGINSRDYIAVAADRTWINQGDNVLWFWACR